MSKSYELVKWHRDVPITAEDISAAEDTITKECRYYLIGKLAEQEKRNRNSDETNNRLLARIGKKVGYSAPRVSRACTYVKAIESLERNAPDIVPIIIEGQSRLSRENTMDLSNKSPEEIRAVIEKLSDETVRINEVFPERLSHRPKNQENIERKVKGKIIATVKDLPEYDPDAQISSLTYTIPSWIDMIDKAFMNTDFTKVSGSRETPMWSMVYNNLDYETEARIFANQQKYVNPLSAYDVFAADIEAGEDKPIIIQDLVESYGLKIAPKRAICSICAVYCLVQLYEKYGYHVLDRTLRLAVTAWEGESQSLSASMLRGIAHLVITFGEQLRDDGFVERIGQSSSREIVRDAKMRSPGAIGYSEVMLIAYNKNRKGCLSMSRLRDSKSYVYQNTEEITEEQAVSASES
jgi:hypothetical protein